MILFVKSAILYTYILVNNFEILQSKHNIQNTLRTKELYSNGKIEQNKINVVLILRYNMMFTLKHL